MRSLPKLTELSSHFLGKDTPAWSPELTFFDSPRPPHLHTLVDGCSRHRHTWRISSDPEDDITPKMTASFLIPFLTAPFLTPRSSSESRAGALGADSPWAWGQWALEMVTSSEQNCQAPGPLGASGCEGEVAGGIRSIYTKVGEQRAPGGGGVCL